MSHVSVYYINMGSCLQLKQYYQICNGEKIRPEEQTSQISWIHTYTYIILDMFVLLRNGFNLASLLISCGDIDVVQ